MPLRAKITVRAAAKINLLLYVLGPAPGGYHRILSLMQMVSLSDRLTLIPRPLREGIQLVTRARDIPRDGDNLVVRAARAFMNHYGIKAGLRIELEKKIPVGAGLGGGSSDAAAILRGLGRMYRTPGVPTEQIKLARGLGSDVPFFLVGPCAWVCGTGEEVHPAPARGRTWAVLVNPGFEISTAWSYAELDRVRSNLTPEWDDSLTKMGLTLEANQLKISPQLNETSPLLRRFFHIHNDLEAVAIRRYPVIASLKKRLVSLGARQALMSGSGPTVFGLFSNYLKAQSAAKILRGNGKKRGRSVGNESAEEGWKVWLVRLVDRSGL